MAIRHIVMLKDGSSLSCEVLVKTFVLTTKFGKLKLPKADILSIEYKNPPYADTDEVQVSAATRFKGDLVPDTISVRIEYTSQIVKIPKSDIHSIVLFTGRGKVSAATRQAIKNAT